MAAILVCPGCSSAVMMEDASAPERCTECFREFPGPAREAAERAIVAARREPIEHPRPPLLLTLWLGVSVVDAGKLALAVVGGLASRGPYRLNGESVSMLEITLRAFVPMAVAAWLLAAGAYGVWKERRWTRRALIGFWLAAIPSVLLFTMGGMLASPSPERSSPPGDGFFFSAQAKGQATQFLIVVFAGLAIATWYLYLKPNVREYFARAEGGEPPRVPSPLRVPSG